MSTDLWSFSALSALFERLAEDEGAAGSELEHVGSGLAHVELAESLPEGHADDHQVGLPLADLVHDRRPRLPRLEQLGVDLAVHLRADRLRVAEHLLDALHLNFLPPPLAH